MRIVSANVNGIRAAARKGGLDQLRASEADVICLQETRANDAQLAEVLAAEGFAEHHVVHSAGDQPGRNGVAIISRHPLVDAGHGLPDFEYEGRWLQATVAGPRPVRVASVYVPKGYATPDNRDDPRDVAKARFLSRMTERLAQLGEAGSGVVCGDLNVARSELDIKNWRGRIGRSGFLESERAVLDSWESAGWHDVCRELAGEVPGPYTWWTMRGRAFDNDAGWRIDYCWTTGDLAERARGSQVLRADTWDQRWSDHAPVQVEFG